MSNSSIYKGSTVLLCFLFLFSVFAQEVDIETTIESRLDAVLVLNIDPEARIEFGIKEINENLYHITQSPTDVLFSVEATSNWKMSISTDQEYFSGMSDSAKKFPVDFLGYTIESRGTNWDNGLFSNIANRTKDTIIALRTDERLVMINGNKNNIGGADENTFILRWKFIFEGDTAKLNRMRELKVKDDYYTGQFFITLSESQESAPSK